MAGIVLGVYYGFVLGYFTRSYVYKKGLKKTKLKRVKIADAPLFVVRYQFATGFFEINNIINMKPN